MRPETALTEFLAAAGFAPVPCGGSKCWVSGFRFKLLAFQVQGLGFKFRFLGFRVRLIYA